MCISFFYTVAFLQMLRLTLLSYATENGLYSGPLVLSTALLIICSMTALCCSMSVPLRGKLTSQRYSQSSYIKACYTMFINDTCEAI